jgi:hypothetical protein
VGRDLRGCRVLPGAERADRDEELDLVPHRAINRIERDVKQLKGNAMSEAVQNSLAAEADAARERIAERLETLQDRLEPKKLVRETVEPGARCGAHRDAPCRWARHVWRSAACGCTTDFLRENAAISAPLRPPVWASRWP